MQSILKVLLCFLSILSSFVLVGCRGDTQPDTYKFAHIPGGKYEIGNVIGDKDIDNNPVRSVTLSPYSMAVNDVTKTEWDIVQTWALTHGVAGRSKCTTSGRNERLESAPLLVRENSSI